MRGSIVVVALQGDFGKCRPALIIQSNFFEALQSITILPITGDLKETPLYRVNIEATPETGLEKASQIMVDKAQTISKEKIGKIIGHLDEKTMLAINRSLALFLGIA